MAKRGHELQNEASSPSGGPTSLPDPVRQQAEQRLGIPLSTLRLFLNSPEPRRLGTDGLSEGSSIQLAPGADQATLGHELVHFAQGQRHGQLGESQLDQGGQSRAEVEASQLGPKVFAPDGAALQVSKRRDARVHRNGDVLSSRPQSFTPAGLDALGLFPKLQKSFSPSAAQAMSESELKTTAQALKTMIATTAESSAENLTAAGNLKIVEAEGVRRNLAIWQLDDNAEALAKRPGGAPVVFALNEDNGQIYASVAAGGATMTEIATYVYGSPGEAGALASENCILASVRLQAGAAIKLIAGRQSAVANAAIATSRTMGTLIRTNGISDLTSKSDMAYLVPSPTGVMQVNDAQFDAMLRAMRRRTRNMLQIYVDSIAFLKTIRNDHESGSNSVVRGISDWSGDVDLPGTMRYDIAIANGNAILALLDGLEFAEDPRATASKLAELEPMATGIMLEEAKIEAAWVHYINGTISGAEKTVERLETVRNVSFVAVAGMAGALAAPAAFAALGTAGVTGGTATGLSLAAAGGTGAVVGGGLEVVLPGAQADKPVGERFKKGAWSGGVAGFTGGAGSFLTPVVSSTVTGQIAARTSQQFVQSTTGQVVTRTATGVIVGAPSGAVSAGIENLPAYSRGDMSGDQYAGSIGWGTAGGGVAGGVFGNVPVKGFARDGMPFNPKAAPYTPEWTLAGPYSPIAQLRGGTAGFNNLPAEGLPAFADDPGVAGYSWTKVRSGGTDRWVPIHSYGPKQEFDLQWYGDPANPANTANYNLLYGAQGNPNGSRLVGSRTIQRPAGQGYAGMQANDPFPGAPRSGRKDFPMTTDDFEVTMPDGTVRRMVRGHQVDFFDTTARTTTIPDSNLDVANFTPEPTAWGGLGGRNRLTMRIRASGTGTEVRQINLYGRSNIQTASGKPVPEAIYLVEMGPNGRPARAWRVPFNDPTAFQGANMQNAGAIDINFGVSNLASVPNPVEIDPGTLPAAVAAMAMAEFADEQQK